MKSKAGAAMAEKKLPVIKTAAIAWRDAFRAIEVMPAVAGIASVLYHVMSLAISAINGNPYALGSWNEASARLSDRDRDRAADGGCAEEPPGPSGRHGHAARLPAWPARGGTISTSTTAACMCAAPRAGKPPSIQSAARRSGPCGGSSAPEQPMVLTTRKDFPADNLPQFIDYVKKNGANLQFGSAGTGTTTHLGCALLNAVIGVNITHVPYRGGGPAANDL